jgi:WD40 repeat protein
MNLVMLALVGLWPDRPPQDCGDPIPAGVLTRLASGRMRHTGRLRAMAVSPDNKSLAAGGAHSLRVWDRATGKLSRHFRIDSDWGHLLTFSADGLILTSVDGYHDLTCRRLDLATGKDLCRFHLDLDADAELSGDGSLLVVVGEDKTARLFDTATGRKTGVFKVEVDGNIVVRPDGMAVAVMDAKGGAVRMYAIPSGNLLAQLQQPLERFAPLAFSRDGRLLAANSGRTEDAIHIWDMATGTRRLRLQGSRGNHTAVTFSPDGKLLAATGPQAPEVGLWDVTTGRQVRRFRAGPPLALAVFSADGKALFAASPDGAILVWDLDSGRLLPVSADPSTAVRDLRFARDGKRLSGRADGFQVWDPATGREVHKLPEAPGVSCLSPDETLLACGDKTGRIRLLDAATGREVRSWKAHGRLLWTLQFSPDGKQLISTGGWEPVIQVWDVATGHGVMGLPGHREGDAQLTVSPDGRFVAACGNRAADDADLRLWDLQTGRESHRLSGRLAVAHHPAFSPDGRRLAAVIWRPEVANAYEIVQVWELATGQLVSTLPGHRDAITAVAFSADGRMIAIGSTDHSVRLWQVNDAQERQRLLGHRGTILSLAFSPDNQRLAASSPEAPVYVWDVAAATRPNRPPAAMVDAQREALWEGLASEDAGKAYRAVLALATTPLQTLALARKKLRAAPPPDLGRIQKLVADLDSPRFSDREQASAALEQLPDGAAGPLRQALKDSASLEVRKRLQRILESFEELTPERLRAVRAVEALEQLGTVEALRFLAELARGAPEATLTREAAAARDRLRRSGEGR